MNHLATSSVVPPSPTPLLGRGFGPRHVSTSAHARPSLDRRWSDDGVVVALAITAAALMMAVAMAIVASLAMAGASAAENTPVAAPVVRADGTDRASGAASTPVRVTRVFVRPGDSLWSIALRVAPAEDPRRVVLRLDRARARPGPLQVGEVILVAAVR